MVPDTTEVLWGPCLDTAELFWQLKGDLHNIRKMVEDVLESLLVGTSKLHASGGRRRGQVRCVASTRPSLSDSLSSGRCLFVCVCNIVCLSRIGIDV